MAIFSHLLREKGKKLSLAQKFRSNYYSLYSKNLTSDCFKSLFYLLCGTIYLLKEKNLEKKVNSLQKRIDNWSHYLAH